MKVEAIIIDNLKLPIDDIINDKKKVEKQIKEWSKTHKYGFLTSFNNF